MDIFDASPENDNVLRRLQQTTRFTNGDPASIQQHMEEVEALALSCEKLGDYKSAVRYRKSLSSTARYYAPKDYPRCLLDEGIAWLAIKLPRGAEQCFEKLIKLAEEEALAQDEPILEAIRYFDIGAAYAKASYEYEAKDYLDRALEICNERKVQDGHLYLDTLSMLGDVELELGNEATAKTYFSKVLELSKGARSMTTGAYLARLGLKVIFDGEGQSELAEEVCPPALLDEIVENKMEQQAKDLKALADLSVEARTAYNRRKFKDCLEKVNTAYAILDAFPGNTLKERISFVVLEVNVRGTYVLASNLFRLAAEEDSLFNEGESRARRDLTIKWIKDQQIPKEIEQWFLLHLPDEIKGKEDLVAAGIGVQDHNFKLALDLLVQSEDQLEKKGLRDTGLMVELLRAHEDLFQAAFMEKDRVQIAEQRVMIEKALDQRKKH